MRMSIRNNFIKIIQTAFETKFSQSMPLDLDEEVEEESAKILCKFVLHSKKTLLSDDGEMVYFNPFWLYQSFEVIFIQGGVHW